MSNETDSIWVNIVTKEEIDIDELYGIGVIKATIYDPEDECFFLLCNYRKDDIGFYIIMFEAKNPRNYSFLTRWNHKLIIGDANMEISRGVDQIDNRPFKELIVSYKSESINVFQVITLDLS